MGPSFLSEVQRRTSEEAENMCMQCRVMKVALLIVVAHFCACAGAVPLHRPASLPVVTEVISGVSAGDAAYFQATNGTHYEDPYAGKCSAEEVNITIVNIKGAMCSPVCGLMDSCPKDVPTGVKAHPKCALQDMAGRKFCALLCSMSVPFFDQAVADAQCGPKASCKPIASVGICTYDR